MTPEPRADDLAAEGRRVLLLASSPTALHGEGDDESGGPAELPTDLRPAALVVLAERVRDDAADTHALFHRARRRLEGDLR